MALNNEGTLVQISANRLPDGYVKPTVTEVVQEYIRSETLSIVKSGEENADPLVTMANIVAQITTDVSAIITADMDTVGLAVDVHTVLKGIVTDFTLAGVMFTDGAINYLCDVDVYVKTT